MSAIREIFLNWFCGRRGYRVEIFNSNEHVCIFPELNIVYNRIKKSGNTTVAAFFHELSLGLEGDLDWGFKSSLLTPRKAPYSVLFDFDSFYTLTVVRNPFVRTLSTFCNKIEKGVPGIYQGVGGHGVAGREGFIRYLRHLQSGHLYANKHFWPQVDLLYQPVDQFSRIVKLENIVADMAKVLVENGIEPAYARRLSHPHGMELASNKVTRSSERAIKYFDREAIQIVQQLYENDFHSFGYSQEFKIPGSS